MTRVFVCVLDGVGAGELPDAAAYGDEGSDTLRHVLERSRRRAARTSWASDSPRSPACRWERRGPGRPTAASWSTAPARTPPPGTGR